MSETKISKKIREMIEKEFPQIAFDRMHCGKVRVKGGYMNLAKPGWADYIGFLPDGRFFSMEVKDPEGTTKKERAILQKANRDAINAAGGFAIQVESVEQAREMIKEALKGCD